MKFIAFLLPLIVLVSTNDKDLTQDGTELLTYQERTDVDDLSLHSVHQNLNKESLTVHHETKMKNLTKTCEEAMGKCISKKGICKGSVDKSITCDKKKHICCISDSIELELKNMKEILLTLQANYTEVNNKLDSQTRKLDALGCPSGFFMMPLGPKCYKLLHDKQRTWMEAKDACNSIGCVMARPADPVTLRKYIVGNIGRRSDKDWPHTWLAARGGSGSWYDWDEQVGGGRIETGNPFWYPNSPSSSTGSSYCLFMVNTDGDMKSHPNTPYSAATCTANIYALCEYIKE